MRPLLAALAAFLVLTSCGDKPPDAPHTYLLGEKAEVGHIVYTAFDTQWLTEIPQSPTPRVPQHRFLLVRMSSRNAGGSSLLVPNLTIEDERGKSYSELNNGDGVAKWIGFLRQVKPSESIEGYALFDAPATHYKLRVKDETEDKAALIDLPFALDAGPPAVPLPGEKK